MLFIKLKVCGKCRVCIQHLSPESASLKMPEAFCYSRHNGRREQTHPLRGADTPTKRSRHTHSGEKTHPFRGADKPTHRADTHTLRGAETHIQESRHHSLTPLTKQTNMLRGKDTPIQGSRTTHTG
jgi:hypothetical protein